VLLRSGMRECLAYFLTWTTYGTRLHGDARGTVDRAHNRVGTPFLEHNPRREAAATDRSRQSAFVLTTEARDIVNQAIRDHAAKRAWDILALNIRTNHVHVVVNCRGSHPPELAARQFKSWGTRRLIASGLATPQTRLWTDHASTRYIDSADSLMSAIDYVANRQ
jgi:REP element-mobilizing transposase RayT